MIFTDLFDKIKLGDRIMFPGKRRTNKVVGFNPKLRLIYLRGNKDKMVCLMLHDDGLFHLYNATNSVCAIRKLRFESIRIIKKENWRRR